MQLPDRALEALDDASAPAVEAELADHLVEEFGIGAQPAEPPGPGQSREKSARPTTSPSSSFRTSSDPSGAETKRVLRFS